MTIDEAAGFHMLFPNTTAITRTLDNGTTVILDSHSLDPVVSAQIWVATGSIHEEQHTGAGISHLLEHMVFKGTEKYSANKLAKTVQAAGGQWNAYTSFDRTVYYIDGPSESTHTFLRALTQMVYFPTLPEQEYEKEKDVIRREIDMGLDDPDGVASRLLFSTAFNTDARNQPVIGHLELFNKISHDDLVNYHRKHYTPQNTFICISGDVDIEETIERLNALTKELPRTAHQPVVPAVEPLQLGARVASETFAIPATKLTLAWKTPSIHHQDAAALDLLSIILGGGSSSMLYQTVRQKHNLVHHIASWSYITNNSPGLFAISAELDEKNTAKTIQKIHRVIQKTITAKKLKAALKKAKRITLTTQIHTLTSAAGRASDLASNWHETRNLNHTADYLKSIESLTPYHIRHVAKIYLTKTQTLTTTTLNPLVPEVVKPTKKANQKSTKVSAGRELHLHRLSNGLPLVISSDHRTPTISIQAATRAGLSAQTPENAGISSLLATLLTKGTTSQTQKQIATKLDSLGASLRASGGNNTSFISASCLTPDIETILHTLADVYSSPSLDPQHIEHERNVQLSTLQEQNEDPMTLAFRTLKAAHFAQTGYGIPSIGTELTLASLDRNQLLSHHQTLYNANNAAIAIFGDILPEKAIELAETYLSTIPTGARHQYPAQPTQLGQNHHLQLDKQQAVLALAYPGATIHDEHQQALDLLHAYCADMAGPLFTNIREKHGLAYYASATQFHAPETGLFTFYLGTSPEQLEQAQAILLETIQDLMQSPLKPKMLQNIKTNWLAKQALANQSNRTIAQLTAIDTVLDLPVNNLQLTAEKIQNLTAEDLQRAAQYHFSQPATMVTVSP